jgi:hypothetical protein
MPHSPRADLYDRRSLLHGSGSNYNGYNAFSDTDDDYFLFDNKPDTIGPGTRSQNYSVH